MWNVFSLPHTNTFKVTVEAEEWRSVWALPISRSPFHRQSFAPICIAIAVITHGVRARPIFSIKDIFLSCPWLCCSLRDVEVECVCWKIWILVLRLYRQPKWMEDDVDLRLVWKLGFSSSGGRQQRTPSQRLGSRIVKCSFSVDQSNLQLLLTWWRKISSQLLIDWVGEEISKRVRVCVSVGKLCGWGKVIWRLDNRTSWAFANAKPDKFVTSRGKLTVQWTTTSRSIRSLKVKKTWSSVHWWKWLVIVFLLSWKGLKCSLFRVKKCNLLKSTSCIRFGWEIKISCVGESQLPCVRIIII